MAANERGGWQIPPGGTPLKTSAHGRERHGTLRKRADAQTYLWSKVVRHSAKSPFVIFSLKHTAPKAVKVRTLIHPFGECAPVNSYVELDPQRGVHNRTQRAPTGNITHIKLMG